MDWAQKLDRLESSGFPSRGIDACRQGELAEAVADHAAPSLRIAKSGIEGHLRARGDCTLRPVWTTAHRGCSLVRVPTLKSDTFAWRIIRG